MSSPSTINVQGCVVKFEGNKIQSDNPKRRTIFLEVYGETKIVYEFDTKYGEGYRELYTNSLLMTRLEQSINSIWVVDNKPRTFIVVKKVNHWGDVEYIVTMVFSSFKYEYVAKLVLFNQYVKLELWRNGKQIYREEYSTIDDLKEVMLGLIIWNKMQEFLYAVSQLTQIWEIFNQFGIERLFIKEKGYTIVKGIP